MVSGIRQKGDAVAYFLKQSRNKKGLYLQIYESFYDPEKRQTRHRSIRALGYEHELREGGVAEPVAHFKAEVARMNEERAAEKRAERGRRIGEESPERFAGYFAAKAVDSALGAREDLAWLQVTEGFRFSLPDVVSSLVYARLCCPRSKSRTVEQVLPRLFEEAAFSLDQVYAALPFLGRNASRVIGLYNARVAEAWPRDTSRAYFDCTNFYFEIDAEDALRRKGPSKERRPDPIVGMGLLLDADCIPLGMSVFPGNESEKPQMRAVIEGLRRQGSVEGRTVRVADKGLNCAASVVDALSCGDGYLFSKSIKQLDAKDRRWALSEEGWQDVRAQDGSVKWRFKEVVDAFDYRAEREGGAKERVSLTEKRVATYSPALARKQLREIDKLVNKARGLRLGGARRSEFGECGKYVEFRAVDADGCLTDDAVAASLNHAKIEADRAAAGYNMLVTSETSMVARDVYEAYRGLWRIEETFRAMKSQLEARPVYLSNPDSIKGHFLICYLAVLLLRILQVKVLGGEFGTEEIVDFVRDFRVVKASERRYINVLTARPLADRLEEVTGLPVNNAVLTKAQLDKMMGYEFKPSQPIS